jgi:diacylglycerol kinase (ATP)
MAFNLRERAYSFRHAIHGIFVVIRTQPNAWIHLAATLAVLIAGKLLNVTRGEWLALVIAIGLVWTAEALNTAIEFLADEISLERRDRLGLAKDTGAAGVLLAAITAAIIGLIVFVPHLLALAERS